MTENAQLALIAVLGSFLTGVITLGGIYLNVLLSRQTAMKAQIEVATQKGDTAARKADSAANIVEATSQAVMESMAENTQITKQVHGIVNGERTALVVELAKTKDELKNVIVENAALKTAALVKGVSP